MKELIQAAKGEVKVDVLIKNAQVVDVLNSEIFEENVAIHRGKIVGFGEYKARETIDAKQRYLLPGLIDAHIHLESSLLSPWEFARCVVKHGTTAVICDPHEIANVLGIKGIKWILSCSKELPIDIYIMVPSCVPATCFETSGAKLGIREMKKLLKEKRVLGLAEVMDYPAVINCEKEMLKKLELHELKDGHAPMLSGNALNAYIMAGIYTEHECTSKEEAKEKLRKGMRVLIREGSSAKNLEELLPLINERNARRFCFASDDKNVEDLCKGHVNEILRKAVALGLDPVIAVQLATINTAECYGLKRIGAISIGYNADLVLVRDLKDFEILWTMKNGKLVNGKVARKKIPRRFLHTIRIKPNYRSKMRIKAEDKNMRVIKVIENQIITKELIVEPKIEHGYVVSDVERDILKLVVIERHKRTGRIGVAFVHGFGLKRGAIASSVAHDSHNIIAVGTNDDEIATCIETLKNYGGGIVVVDKVVKASLPLQIAGLISTKTFEEVKEEFRKVKHAAHEIGCVLKEPFMQLSFLALPVIPELKLTDKGLFDVRTFSFVPLWVD